MSSRLRVIKVGGSLFDLPDLAGRISNWLDTDPDPYDWNILIAGGGPLCDFIRYADDRFRLGEEAAHWLCVRALDTTSGLLASLLACEEVFSTRAIHDREPDLHQSKVVLNAARFLFDEESRLPGTTLPHGWIVTTDSIAARVAEATDARELVLMKSVSVGTESHESLVERKIVDEYFPQAAQDLPSVRVVNLRNSDKF